MTPKYQRILIKISGEALSSKDNSLDPEIISRVVNEIKTVHDMDVKIGIVIGGGNFWRGRQGRNMDKATADHMGMLATVINALALQDALEMVGVPTRVMTALTISRVAEPYIQRKALRHMEKGRVIIFACGTGNPFFTTDTGAALRAAEMNSDVILLAKNVDAVYDSDPRINPDAKRISEISYMDIIQRNLGVMDMTAVSLCMDSKMPIIVFGLNEEHSISRAVCGEINGTYIH